MQIDTPILKEPIVVEPRSGEKPVIKVESPQIDYEKKKKIVRYKEILWYILLVIEALLLIRFLLKLFGANPLNIFSIIINIISIPFTILFIGLFPSTVSLTGRQEIEWSTLFAMLFYAILIFVISRFYRLKKPIDPKEAEEKVEKIMP
ncbi:MAG: hypothetical protein ACD_38C00185G0002 [uncultured bacterium]|uniref:YGGT family protein n=1 Tax=Candidatus Daviesbacteria bacterium GW2011_GWC2_40_12 TaxID=1618431 RepID=A0A0G0QPU0_9BACT|nr:MAG: hypothetical protein ACD_38C00185G0002 [uncultured bacterium]KKR16759.1 MAG: hypothetical protein UT45_C0004G0090 [Candidatus Daviesbacteria bacterium GW2011_GWA2_39_33]KKR42459.1 MAG: hypothetical protein UT77_C0002G0112 [Candidatus Daviesbacteria bacterium GW2011_GWC2_40_12]OGE22373.1 MAG: hypothetical protein A2778_00830 [Candidatus Daviesbacteria bacterium RIFCSPHIGHO2_01_FULL_40_24]OGE28460.1 MAG: hypothetical protein A3C29_05825 [Candidatus Daviesbacteria bacterium RIFCSPHIGHO2_02